MRTRYVWVVGLLTLHVGSIAIGQQPKPPEAVQKAGEVLAALADIELLLVVAPLQLNKEQVSKLIPLLEQAQSDLMRMEERNAQALLQLRDEVMAARREALRGTAPSEELRKKLREADNAAVQHRLKTVDQVVRTLWAQLEKTLNDSQKATLYNWSREQLRAARQPDVEKMSRQQLGEFFTREVLLAPRLLTLLQEMQKAME